MDEVASGHIGHNGQWPYWLVAILVILASGFILSIPWKKYWPVAILAILARSLHRVSHFNSLRQSPVQYPAHQETTLLATNLTPSIIITMLMVPLALLMMK